jgi:hypothetical protein
MTNAQGSRGKQAVGLTAVAPLQLTGDRRSAFAGPNWHPTSIRQPSLRICVATPAQRLAK